MGKIRKWNNILHRDIGYLAVGLTIIFAISGIAVNHVDLWNPNYKITKERIALEIEPTITPGQLAGKLRREYTISDPAESVFKPAPDQVQVFFPGQTFTVNLKDGSGTREVVRERVLLRDFNYLHLNHAKKLWPWISDLYAAALLFLAVSGLFVLKGKNGLSGRGKWLTGIGFLIPLFFLILYKYWS